MTDTLKEKPILTEEEDDSMARNQEHLKIMIGKDYWTTEDLAPGAADPT